MAAIISWTFPIFVEWAKGLRGRETDGGYYSFIFFSFMMLLQLIFVWRALPETKGKSLESIQKELGIH